jgi:hypothetical protein
VLFEGCLPACLPGPVPRFRLGPGCFPGDSREHTLRIGVTSDAGYFHAGYFLAAGSRLDKVRAKPEFAARLLFLPRPCLKRLHRL